MPEPLIPGCCCRPVAQLHPWGQSSFSHHLQKLNYTPPWKILTIARAVCTLIWPAHWGQSILTSIIEMPSLERLWSCFKSSGFWRKSRLGETFPLEFLKHSLFLWKKKRDVMQNSCIGTSWVGQSSMPMQHSQSTSQASYGEQILSINAPGIRKKIQ